MSTDTKACSTPAQSTEGPPTFTDPVTGDKFLICDYGTPPFNITQNLPKKKLEGEVRVYLGMARSMGTYLIVGLISDQTAESYKRRPVMSLPERCHIFSSCKYVDAVIPGSPLFISDEFIDQYEIDLFVHGDDFTQEKINKYYGPPFRRGLYKSFPYTPGVSTTDIIERCHVTFLDIHAGDKKSLQLESDESAVEEEGEKQ